MPPNTRQKILETAKRLFGERGYNDVTTRDIADELGISKGNLTYHFKKKEDIVEALFDEIPDHNPATPPRTIVELHAYFKDIESTVRDYAFYFWHHAQLAQASHKIEALQKSTFSRKSSDLAVSLSLLAAAGLVKAESYPGEYARVSDTLMLAGIYWIPFCKLQDNDSAIGYTQQAWSIVHPLLTETARAEMGALKDDGIAER